MGLFGKKEVCSICGNDKNIHSIADGCVCATCLYNAGGYTALPKQTTVDEIKRKLQDEIEGSTTKQSALPEVKLVGNHLELDNKNRTFKIVAIPKLYKYDDILEFELIEDDKTITKGGIGAAITGGLLFGGAGAIAGSVIGKKTKRIVNRMQIVITMKTLDEPSVLIGILGIKTNTDSITYHSACADAQEIIAALSIITNPQHCLHNSVADEIEKLKCLLDSEAITKEEFERAKANVLR